MKPFLLHNAKAVDLAAVPVASFDQWRAAILKQTDEGGRLVALFAAPSGHTEQLRVYAVVAGVEAGFLSALCADISTSYAALTPDCLQAHWFEREIFEQWGVKPEGHPWLKPIRFQPALAADSRTCSPAGVTNFLQMSGEEAHEVAVGPVHAGIIEPGHFRFLCHGENVYHLEISLGYQHRGIERALAGGPNMRTMPYMETLAGDTTVGHSLAYCGAVEALAGVAAPARAASLRGIALELERLANHVGDLGALANDIGFLPTASFCGRLRGDYLNITALVCGSRFGRGWLRPGGVAHDVDRARTTEMADRLQKTFRDTSTAVRLLWDTPSVMARFEDTGVLSPEKCGQLGLVGPAARACGFTRDVRFEFPFGIFQFAQIPVASWHTGDVFARAYVRWLEIERSAAFIREQLAALPDGPSLVNIPPLRPNALVVSLAEGWRGEICHTAITDAHGKFATYKIVDPSFHNWMGLALALRNQQISDFPLCNKSFNLSYCGHDL